MFKKKKKDVFENKEKVAGVDYFVTEDGRKVDYLKNPLPLPRKHIGKSMNFAIDNFDDFDIEITPGDDFDIL